MSRGVINVGGDRLINRLGYPSRDHTTLVVAVLPPAVMVGMAMAMAVRLRGSKGGQETSDEHS